MDLLAHLLESLSSPIRLKILQAVRTPRPLHEIRVVQPVRRGGETMQRPLARQSVSRHLVQLERAGLVRRTRGPEKARGDSYVLNHQRLFAIVDEVRNLSKLRPVLVPPLAPEATVDRGDWTGAALPPPPRLLVTYGREDAVAFGLNGPVGERWRIGRSTPCEILLDYDPYLSTEHASVRRDASGFVLTDAKSRNGTWVNWIRLPRGASQPLRPGDLVAVGRSLLVFQS